MAKITHECSSCQLIKREAIIHQIMKKLLFPLAVVLVCVLGFTHHSGSTWGFYHNGTWESIGPHGGIVHGMAMNPKNFNELYALLHWDPSQVFRSTNGGSSWQRICIIQSVCYDIAMSPINSNIIYVLGENSFFKSADKGVTFTEYSLGENCYTFYGRIAVNPKNSDHIYISGIYQNTATLKTCMAVFKSVDGGAHWTKKIFEPTSDEGCTYGISVSPINPEIVYACGYFYKSGSGPFYRVFKSTNAGGTWKNITGPINENPITVLAHPKDINKVYVATYNGIFRSSNGGASWSKQSSPSNLYGGPLAFDCTNPNILYIGSKSIKAFYKSIDGGISWTEYTKGIYGHCYSVIGSGSKILFGSYAGIFKSLNGGVSWKPGHTGMKAADVWGFAIAPSSPAIIYAGIGDYALFKSTNGGRNWQKMPDFYRSDSVTDVAVHPTNPNTVFILTTFCGFGDVYRSEDGGKTFKHLLQTECTNLIISKSNPNHIYVAGQAQTAGNYMGLHFSRDGGDSWTSVKIGSQSGSQATAVDVSPINDNIIYVGGHDRSHSALLYKSTNGGSSWIDITGGIQGYQIYDIVVDPSSPNIVYITGGYGIWKSGDSGVTWTKVSNYGAKCVIINPLNPNEVFSGGGGVFYSNDKGNSWQDVSTDFAFCGNVTWLELNPSARILFASTPCAGIYKRKF